MIRKSLIAALLAALFGIVTYGQFADCSTGLLQSPNAEMQKDGTVMLMSNFLNKHALPSSGWTYNTIQYGFDITLWGRIEIGYVFTIFNGKWDPRPDKSEFWTIMRNQDRHLHCRLLLLREGAFGLDWIPALLVGVSDPVSSTGGDYIDGNTDGIGNGYFNRSYVAITKHFNTVLGEIGTHAGYQFNKRIDYPINGLCIGMNWRPIWLKNKGVLDGLNVIVEYDSRTVNFGMIASMLNNHLEAMIELQNLRWFNLGLRYKFWLT